MRQTPPPPSRCGIVIAATPTTTQASPIQAVGLRLLAEEQHAERDADRHPQIGLRGGADRSQRLDQAEIDHEGEGGREHRKASSASSEFIDGASVQGCSTTRLSGIRTAAPQSSEPAAGAIGSRPLKPRLKIAAPA